MGGRFRHLAFFYRGARDYVTRTTAFIHGGLDAGEPVAVAVPQPKLDLLRSELGASAAQVWLVDMSRAGRNPGRIIPAIVRKFADAHPRTRVRIVSEPIWPGRNEQEYPACVQHEALINLALADRAVTKVCPYDAAALSAKVMADAAGTHPILMDEAGEHLSPDYSPEQVLDTYNVPLSEPSAEPVVLTFDSGMLSAVRALVLREARRAGLAADRTLDLELVVSELAANTFEHGGGSGTLRTWRQDGYLICEVRDLGVITDPLMGRHSVDPAVPGGRGVLLVHHLADLVRLHTWLGGTTTRAYFAL
ncbi:sensor histidine kinase [Actinomadura sp. HBU206391]|uniref:sensor histidine kinase n=1 Tax=Actinomadura sp. HBU206391 TaxID=2731692 RepID=UPI002905A5C8|nr:sensor histidine kinase [Actinomadura sp. HBU206391]